ncbi:MAG: hypothetical protein PVF95_04995 [bacterium]
MALCALSSGSHAASAWTSAGAYANVIPAPLLFAMSVDTVFVFGGPEARSPALPYAVAPPPAAPNVATSAGAADQKGGISAPETVTGRPPGESKIVPAPGRTGDGGVAVTLSLSALLEAEPGKIITARFMVNNETTEEKRLRETVAYPRGWARVASAEPDFTLGAGGAVVRLVTFHIPPDYPAGVYNMQYEVMDPAAPHVRGATDFSVTVLPQLDLRSKVLTAPRTVVAGGEFSVLIKLLNSGNTRAAVRIKATVRPDYDFSVDPGDLLIPSGESRTVRVRVKTDKRLPHKTMCMVILKAATEDEIGQTSTIEEAVTVDVIPRVTRLTDPYYRLPSWIRLTAAADRNSAGGQIEISGSGAVAGDTDRTLSYVVRQASTPAVGRFASWNEYYVNYRGRHLEINLGDRVFSLSPLVQRFYYGEGAGADLRAYNVALGGYYARSRSEHPRHREAGGYISFLIRPGLSVKANVLEKDDASYAETARSKHRIASLQGNYAPVPNARFELEYGVDAEEAPGNYGYRFAANGVLRNKLFFSLEKVHAGPAFYGYTTDTDFMLGTFQFPVQPGLTLRLSYRSYDNNLELDPLKLTASRERHVTAGVSYIATVRTRLNLDFQDFQRWDGFAAPGFDFGEKTLRASVDYSLPYLSLYLSGEHGYSQNDMTDTRTSLGRYSLSASIRPGARHSYSIYAGYGHSKYSESPRKSGDLGMSARWHLTKDLDMNLNYHMSGAPSLVENTYRILTYSLYYLLPNRHMVTMKTSVWGGKGSQGTDSSVLLSYSIPAPIPMGRKKTVGTVKGRVYDAEDPRRPGLANAIITADGVAAVSNARGEFEFPSLEPGTYSLQVDAKSIGLGRVTEAKSPFVVVVEGGRTARIDVGVVRSCSIRGEVLMFDLEPDGDGAEVETGSLETGEPAGEAGPMLVGLGKGRDLPHGAHGLPDVLVEITNGEYYLTQYTASGGRFDFTGLRPGHWTVRVYPEGLPHYYFLEAEAIVADLAAGDETLMTFRILPRQRRINIMDEGEIKQEGR